LGTTGKDLESGSLYLFKGIEKLRNAVKLFANMRITRQIFERENIRNEMLEELKTGYILDTILEYKPISI
jgi:hypothetical protein